MSVFPVMIPIGLPPEVVPEVYRPVRQVYDLGTGACCFSWPARYASASSWGSRNIDMHVWADMPMSPPRGFGEGRSGDLNPLSVALGWTSSFK